MSLREDMWKYEQITGESAEHVPIIKLGAFLDGYDMGIKALEREASETFQNVYNLGYEEGVDVGYTRGYTEAMSDLYERGENE